VIVPNIDLRTVRFGEPQFLLLLVVPAVLLLAWIWQVRARRKDVRRLALNRIVPVRERVPWLGVLVFWLCVIAAITSLVVALARPQSVVAMVRTAGVDLVILQDGSASMRVKDVAGDRWQRSMAFLRVFGDSVSWKDDRIAMALFAHIAAPQIRLTRDPNTFFFFLDHLSEQPPFRLQDDTTWDTNIEMGVYWGLRLIDKDRELHGKSPNAAAFVLLSDGEAWSGEVEKSLKAARVQGVPVFVIGVGTASGGLLPAFPAEQGQPTQAPQRAGLDRAALLAIATGGGGQYFELDREGDQEIAERIIGAVRRRAGNRQLEERSEELYWPLLAVSAYLVILGTLFLRDRMELWVQIAGAVTSLFILSAVLR
jgi:Ca-activated chloride channel family protein